MTPAQKMRAMRVALKCCSPSGCSALVLAGRGYCGQHGGISRLEREIRELRAEESARTRAKARWLRRAA